MPLPKIDLPIYELKLVSIPEPIKFRPFLVKEEKLLLMALQTNDEANIYNAIKQVVNNCLLVEIDIEKLPFFDLEYLFLQLRAYSIGNTVDAYYTCKNMIFKGEDESTECSNSMLIQVDLTQIAPPIKDLPARIQLTNTIGVQMKFPTLKSMRTIKSIVESGDSDAIFRLMYDCMDYIYDAQEVHYSRETSYQEFTEFVESLSQEQFDKIVEFFVNIPTLSYSASHMCEKCGFSHNIKMEGLTDFFI